MSIDKAVIIFVGSFVLALGVPLVWLFTLILIPAYICLPLQTALEEYGYQSGADNSGHSATHKRSRTLGAFAQPYRRQIFEGALLLAAISPVSISKIVTNLFPKSSSHSIALLEYVNNE